MGYISDLLQHLGSVPGKKRALYYRGIQWAWDATYFPFCENRITSMVSMGVAYGDTSLQRLFRTMEERLSCERNEFVGGKIRRDKLTPLE
jgi:hypothetical protein